MLSICDVIVVKKGSLDGTICHQFLNVSYWSNSEYEYWSQKRDCKPTTGLLYNFTLCKDERT